MSKRRPYPADIQTEVAQANRERREVQLTDEQMSTLGHGPRPLAKVIREFCVDCMGGNRAEVRRCTSVGCSLYPYRFGRNPYHGQRTSVSKPAQNAPVQPDRGVPLGKTSTWTGGTS